MRAPFNTTCELFAGPLSSTPGVSRGVFACRHVLEDGIHSQQLDPGQPWVPAYLTIQGYRPKGMFVSPKFTVIPGAADVVAIPAGSQPKYLVWYTDFIRWKGQARYYRAYLIDLSSFPSGGVVINGLAIVHPGHNVTLGGVVCDGHVGPILLALPAGGVLLGGAATIIPGKPLYIGGVLIGGIAIVVPGGPYKPVGGILIGGTAHVVPGSAYKPIGGVLLGGLATVVPGSAYRGIGGLLLGGLATVVPGKALAYTGGVLLGGTGSWQPLTGVQGMFVGYNSFTPVEVDLELYTGSPSGLVTGDAIVISNMVHSAYLNGNWTLTALGGGLGYSLNSSNGTLVTNPGVDVGPTGGRWYKL